MARKLAYRGGRSRSLSTEKVISGAKSAGVIAAGLVVGSKLSSMITQQSARNAGVMGLDGPSVKITGPSVLTAAGLVLAASTKNETVRTFSYGMAAAGAVQMVGQFTGVQVNATNGLGYTMEELPDPTVQGLLAPPAYVDDDGNAYDEEGNRINGIDGPAYVDDDGNAYDEEGNRINGLDGEDDLYVADADGNVISGLEGSDDAKYLLDAAGTPVAVRGVVDGQHVWIDSAGNVIGLVEGVEGAEGVEGMDGDPDGALLPGLGAGEEEGALLPGLGSTVGAIDYGAEVVL